MLSDDEEERKAIICKDTMTMACRHDDDVSPAEASPSISQRPFYFAILFLSLTILIDTAAGKGGPLQTWAEIIIPQLVRRYATTRPLFTDEEVGIDGKICPPDGFLDQALLPQTNSASQAKAKQTNEVTYSSGNDPRNKKSKPSSFPHCELKKWVQLHQHTQSQHTTTIGSRKCPVGQEYITHIYPKQFKSQQRTKTSTSKHSQSNNNVKILHIATPTNCIPTSTISSLQSFTEHYYSNNSNPNNPQIIIAIYIHSQETMDAFLYQRVWNVFPEVKEGLLCGMAKIRFVVGKVLDDLVKSVVVVGGGAKEDASSTNEKEKQEQQQQQLRKDNIANDIATLAKRDIWRYLILWEFGGTVIDLEVLQSLMDTPNNNAAETPATSPLINVARQWFASEWFGKTNDTADSNSSSSITFSDGDAIITIVENDGGKRVPLTGIITASPNHPLLYFCVKWALRSMIDDNYLVWGESPDFVSDLSFFSELLRCMQVRKLNVIESVFWPFFFSSDCSFFCHESFFVNRSVHSMPWAEIQTMQHCKKVSSTC